MMIDRFLERIRARPCSRQGLKYDVPVTSRLDLDIAAASEPTIRFGPRSGYALFYHFADGVVMLMGRGSCGGVVDAKAYVGRGVTG